MQVPGVGVDRGDYVQRDGGQQDQRVGKCEGLEEERGGRPSSVPQEDGERDAVADDAQEGEDAHQDRVDGEVEEGARVGDRELVVDGAVGVVVTSVVRSTCADDSIACTSASGHRNAATETRTT